MILISVETEPRRRGPHTPEEIVPQKEEVAMETESPESPEAKVEEHEESEEESEESAAESEDSESDSGEKFSFSHLRKLHVLSWEWRLGVRLKWEILIFLSERMKFWAESEDSETDLGEKHSFSHLRESHVLSLDWRLKVRLG